MKANIKKRWIAALRSGKYQQTKGRLRRVRGGKITHCCLGVLGELYCEATKQSWNNREVNLKQGLSLRVQNWAGLPDSLGARVKIVYKEPSLRGYDYYLAEHNDKSATFAQIADAIDEQM